MQQKMSTKVINLYDSLIEIWSNNLNLYLILDESVKTLIIHFAAITNALTVYKWIHTHYIHAGYLDDYKNIFKLFLTEQYTFSFKSYGKGSKKWRLYGNYEMIHETKIRLVFDDKSMMQIIKNCIAKEKLRDVYLKRIKNLRIKDVKSKKKVVEMINKMILDPYDCYRTVCKRLKVKPLPRYYGNEWNVVLNKNRNKCQIKHAKEVIYTFDKNKTEEIDSGYQDPTGDNSDNSSNYSGGYGWSTYNDW